MKQLLFLLFALFFSFSNAQNHFFKKETRHRPEIEKLALRTSGNIVVLIDSMTYESSYGWQRSIIEYTDFGFIGITEERDREEAVWSKDELFFFYINAIQQVDSFLVYDKDNETDDWENYVGERFIYEYDANGNEISELHERYRDSSILSYKNLRLSFYNSSDLLDSTISYSLTNNQWAKQYNTQYNYSNEGLLLSKIWCDIDELRNPKTRCNSTQYYYNERLLVDSAFQWSDNILTYKENRFQDKNGNDTLIEWYSWSEKLISWETVEKEIYTYDYEYSTEELLYPFLIYEEMKNLPLTSTYITQGFENDAEDSNTVYFYYSEKNITAISNEKINQAHYYPNPASSMIQVSDEILQTSILNLYGKSILKSNQQTIDVSGLSNGSYMLLLETDKGLVSEKLIISK